MRDYAKLMPTFWTRGSGRKLRGHPEAQLVALYLFSAPTSSMLGIFYCPITTIAHDTGLTIEGAWKGLRRASEAEIAYFDEAEELVWLPAGVAVSVGESLDKNDKRCKGLSAELAKFKNHRFSAALLHKYQRTHHLRVEGLEPSPLEAPSKPLRSQDQEKDQDQEQTPYAGSDEPDHEPDRPEPKHGKPDADRATIDSTAKAALEAIEADASLMPIVQRPVTLAVDLVANGPGVDVVAHIRKAGAWLRANPRQAKKNGNRFLLGWIQRAQESCRGQPSNNRNAPPVQRGGPLWDAIEAQRRAEHVAATQQPTGTDDDGF